MLYNFIVKKDDSYLIHAEKFFFMTKKEPNIKFDEIRLATLDFQVGVIYTKNQILTKVEIIKKQDGYAIKKIESNKFLCKPPFKEENIKQCFFDRNIANEWETFQLEKAPLLKTNNNIKKYLENSFEEKSRIDKHIIIAIRYSLLLENSRLWKIGHTDDRIRYKNKLFDKDRLISREQGFKNITLPSLQNINKNKPKNLNFKVVILTSEDLPEANKLFLKKIEENNSFIDVNYCNPKSNLNDYFKKYLNNDIKDGQMYASVRLDDDDGLSLSWLNQTLTYLQPIYINKVVSLSNGIAALLDEKAEIKKTSPFEWLFGSVGLTYIGQKGVTNSEIYACGSHESPYRRYESIVYSNGIFYIRAYSDFNDSPIVFPNKDCYATDKQKEILKKEFGII